MSRFMDLDDLLDSNQKIYVRNNALKSNLLVIVQMEDRSGRKRALKVPPSRFPICISTQFSKDMIRESSDLRDALAKGVLLLVEPKVAEHELKQDDAKEEIKSFSLSVYADSAPDNAVRDNLQRLKEQSSSPVVSNEEVLAGNSLPNDTIQPRVKALVASVISKEKSSKETLVQLKRLKEALTESDLTYIIRECREETQIKEFAESALANLPQ